VFGHASTMEVSLDRNVDKKMGEVTVSNDQNTSGEIFVCGLVSSL
jgi:hypothetical protein